ncbi:MAG TPA: DUF4255 domain-containing protein [Candidatus Tenderia sp.]|nr:DUF4255 domain-containing protein [Candidatus Tenderia sp.]
MANVKSIHSVCNSIIQFLRNAYPMTDEHPCDFRVLASGELTASADFGTTLSLYLYRVTMNEHLRGTPQPGHSRDSEAPLALDLHFLMTVWSESAAAEQTICAWAMQQLHRHPIMDVSSLSEEGGWRADDVVQIIPAELSNEDLMRIWDALAPEYRLSISYIARVVRIDPDDDETGRPVVATRYQYGERS